MESAWIVARNIGFVALIIAALWALFVMMEREWIKEELRQNGCVPISIRWRWLGKDWWKRWPIYGSSFKVRYSDLFGNIHEAWCVVPRYAWRKVEWVEDEIVVYPAVR